MVIPHFKLLQQVFLKVWLMKVNQLGKAIPLWHSSEVPQKMWKDLITASILIYFHASIFLFFGNTIVLMPLSSLPNRAEISHLFVSTDTWPCFKALLWWSTDFGNLRNGLLINYLLFLNLIWQTASTARVWRKGKQQQLITDEKDCKVFTNKTVFIFETGS